MKDNQPKERRFAPLPPELQGVDFDIRKLTPRECYRLMDVADKDIDRLIAPTYVTKNGKVKPLVSDSAHYRLAGNSIVVSCLYHIFKQIFAPRKGEPTLFRADDIRDAKA